MQQAPKSLRLHIAILGKVNSGKSSFLNLIMGQDVSITSSQEGTTTDIVEKNQELTPLGPVTWIDTAGFGDTTSLSDKRLDKTLQVLDRAEIAILVCNGDDCGQVEEQIERLLNGRKIPIIKVYNKKDLYDIKSEGIKVNSLDMSSRDEVLNLLKAEIIKVCPEYFINQPSMLGDLAPEGSIVIMLTPIDYEAPKGRLIMPQVQAIRDCLDNNQISIVLKDELYLEALSNLKKKPSLIVCDSQIVDFMVSNTPEDVKCTTFSILFARAKGDLIKFVEGAAVIDYLKDGDKVLIAEACTHHAAGDDIGRSKIPRWLASKTEKELDINFVSGHDFPSDLKEYQLVIQCGGCMFNRREILSRVNICEKAGVSITNYGVCISELKGVLDTVLKPFPEALDAYMRVKNGKVSS